MVFHLNMCFIVAHFKCEFQNCGSTNAGNRKQMDAESEKKKKRRWLMSAGRFDLEKLPEKNRGVTTYMKD